MQFLAFATLVALFSASSVSAIDRRIEVEADSIRQTLSVFCNAWQSECTGQAQTTTNLEAYCEPGYVGNGTASVFCVSTVNGVTIDYTQQVIDALHATLA